MYVILKCSYTPASYWRGFHSGQNPFWVSVRKKEKENARKSEDIQMEGMDFLECVAMFGARTDETISLD